MTQLFEFIVEHYLLTSAFVVLLVLFVANEMSRGGAIINSQNLVRLINNNAGVVLDLRDQKSYTDGHIQGAIHLPYSELGSRLTELQSYMDKTIILACQHGQHSGVAGAKLRQGGFTDVRRLEGGVSGWLNSNMPLVKQRQGKRGATKPLRVAP